MIKVRALEGFTLRRFHEINMIERANKNDVDGHITKGDIFECPVDLAMYLTNDPSLETPNPVNRATVEVIEVEPETKEKAKEEIKVEKTKTKTKKNLQKR